MYNINIQCVTKRSHFARRLKNCYPGKFNDIDWDLNNNDQIYYTSTISSKKS